MGTIRKKTKGWKTGSVEEDLRNTKKDPLEERRNTRYRIRSNFRNVDAVRCVDSKEEAVDDSTGASQARSIDPEVVKSYFLQVVDFAGKMDSL
jgi:hypothetical protein